MIEKIAAFSDIIESVSSAAKRLRKRLRPSIDVVPCGEPRDRWLEIKNTSRTSAFNLHLSIDNFDRRAILDEPGLFPIRELPAGQTLVVRYEGYEELSAYPRRVVVTYENKKGKEYSFDEPLQLV
jgi:hypothetical protein